VSMTRSSLDVAAASLLQAAASGVPVDPPTRTWPGFDADDAYAVQLRNVAARLARGHVVVGHKVGLTSVAMQEMLGVSQPDYGHLLDDMAFGNGAALPRSGYIAPRIEPEIAFVLGGPLRGPGCTVDDVMAATATVAPALEIIDSRVRDWQIAFEDTVADNASSAAFVLGEPVPLDHRLDLAAVEVELLVDGELFDRGTGAAVLGHPAAAVAWLANTLADRGVVFEANHVVLPGSCTRAADATTRQHVEARFTDLGSVSASFC
jgi:2-keto-4-pentenoate hydratase